MPSAKASWAAVVLLAMGAPASAQDRTPTPREEYEEATGQPKPVPVIPAELRAMVAEVTPDRLVVRAIDGQSIAVSLDWIEPDRFISYQDGRHLGFSFGGYEAHGYILVDRRRAGDDALIDTGEAPVFSPDGRYFAAAELSDAGWGNLNGIGVWEVLPNATVRRFFTDALYGADWRVDRWLRADCVLVSRISSGWELAQGQDWEQAIRTAPREHFSIEVAGAIAMRARYERPSCADEETP